MDNLSFVFQKDKGKEKYVEDAKEKGTNYEQKKWEEEHLHAAILKFGARDAKDKKMVRIYPAAPTVRSAAYDKKSDFFLSSFLFLGRPQNFCVKIPDLRKSCLASPLKSYLSCSFKYVSLHQN